jgi:TatD DNase family protein
MIDLIDTHTHLDNGDFDTDREACIERALAAGVTRMITIGAGGGAQSAERAIALAEKYPFVWATVGVHPNDAALAVDFDQIAELAAHPKVVGIGETGLDRFWDRAPLERQREYFERQIEIALAVQKPLVIHSRQAGEECFETLQRRGAGAVGGVFHCFSEDAAFAARLRSLNFLVSFPGFISFKKQTAAREVCAAVPLDQIMVETDAPYMAPEPHRGKRCEPAFVVDTARCLAAIHGVSFQEVAARTTANALRLFSQIRTSAETTPQRPPS